MRLYQIIALGALAGMTVGCDVNNRMPTDGAQPLHNQPAQAILIEAAVESYYGKKEPGLWEPTALLYPVPLNGRAGRKVQFFVDAAISELHVDRWLIAVNLLEDNAVSDEVYRAANSMELDKLPTPLLVEKEYHTLQEHTYQLEAIDNFGNRGLSKLITVKFSGEEMDLPPAFRNFRFKQLGEIISNNIHFTLYMGVYDPGDNQGIKKVDLFRDEELIRTFPGNFFSYLEDITVPLEELLQDLEERHSFYAIVYDISGKSTRSETLEWDFQAWKQAMEAELARVQ